jgi:hypothetical protein
MCKIVFTGNFLSGNTLVLVLSLNVFRYFVYFVFATFFLVTLILKGLLSYSVRDVTNRLYLIANTLTCIVYALVKVT